MKDTSASYSQAVRLEEAGRLGEAEALCQEILRRTPGHGDAANLLGILSARRGDLAAAAAAFGQAAAAAPDNPDFRFNLGKAEEMRGARAPAIAAYREAVRLQPEHLDAWINLAGLYLNARSYEAAAECGRRALALRPRSVAAANNLALALLPLGDAEGAERLLREALRVDGRCADTHMNLASVLRKRRDYDGAVTHLRHALSINPRLAEAYSNLGTILKHYGRLDEALVHFRQALAINPGLSGAHSNILFNLNFHPGVDAQAVFAEHVAWGRRFGGAFAGRIAPHANTRLPDRRLRLGYVSPDWRGHSVATFMQPLVAAHDRAAFEVVCYSDVAAGDAKTEWFRSHCDRWRDIVGLSDEAVAAQVRADGIDILVDLAGHTDGNRLLVFARKPAPVQATYLGYLNTSGLAAMDYRITDPFADPPPTADRYHSERLARLPHGLWCYARPDDAPEVGPLPALGRGHLTFASFNNSAKVTPPVVALWARILTALPGARLLMVTAGGTGTQRHFREAFAAHAIDPGRIELVGRRSFQDFLRLHHEVDIALDPFPYSGGTTTFHALWMGVPVITLAGDRPFSRSTVSILSSIGLEDWIAANPDAYAEIAVRRATDLTALAALRAGMRDRMLASPLCDAERFTRNLEALYRRMWRDWCADGSAMA